MKIIVGSRNPVKLAAVTDAFSRFFKGIETIGIDVNSGVSNQPFGDETFKGATNRAMRARDSTNGDFFVGIEGGVVNLVGRWFSFGVVCIIDKDGKRGYGLTPFFELSNQIVKKIKEGKELGDVVDELTGEKGMRWKKGAVGYLTKGAIDRNLYYVQGVTMALIPFINKEMYF